MFEYAELDSGLVEYQSCCRHAVELLLFIQLSMKFVFSSPEGSCSFRLEKKKMHLWQDGREEE